MLEIAYNLDGLDDRQVLQKVKGAHDAVAAKPLVFVTPLPTLLDVIGAHDAAEVNLNLIDSLEAQLTAARLNRLVLMEAARAPSRPGHVCAGGGGGQSGGGHGWRLRNRAAPQPHPAHGQGGGQHGDVGRE